jgi:hypothetical protein
MTSKSPPTVSHFFLQGHTYSNKPTNLSNAIPYEPSIETHESLRAILIQTSTLKYVLLYHVSYKVYCLCLLKSVYCYVVYLQKESNLMQSLCLPFLFTFSPASFNLMSVQIKPIESHNRILWTYKLHVILQNMPIL